MRIVIGCDEAAFELKTIIIDYLKKNPNIEVEDFGSFLGETVLYPDIAKRVAEAVALEKYERGILICGTGIGMAIAANKIPGIRAAVCHDPYSAQRARKSNNAQIMCMGARVIGAELAKVLVDIWLSSEFMGGNSVPKVKRIEEIEKQYYEYGRMNREGTGVKSC